MIIGNIPESVIIHSILINSLYSRRNGSTRLIRINLYQTANEILRFVSTGYKQKCETYTNTIYIEIISMETDRDELNGCHDKSIVRIINLFTDRSNEMIK